MKNIIKMVASRLPHRVQYEIRRYRYARQIARDNFSAAEPDYDRLGDFVTEGDCVIDLGANIGNYTKKLSDLVGPAGRVIAVEPVPETMSLLAANAGLFENQNVTLLNVAASDSVREVGMELPQFDVGLNNFYMAHVSEKADFSVLAIPLDTLGISERVSLIKVDVEGHEKEAIAGMRRLIERDLPVMIVETGSPDNIELLANRKYFLGIVQLNFEASEEVVGK